MTDGATADSIDGQAAGAPRATSRRRPAGGSTERRCIASGRSGPSWDLVRFVADPEGRIVPDLAEKLPGRGAWVSARQDCLERAIKRNLFARSLGRPVVLPADLGDQVRNGLRRRILELIGLCSRAGQVVRGFEKVKACLSAGQAAVLIQAADGAADGRDKLARLALAVDPDLPILAPAGAAALGAAIGREQAVHLALRPGRLAEAILRETRRLEGLVTDGAPGARDDR